ncbi:Vs.1 [Vibrio phage nt-1]|uniref:Vs.1 n=1 Tax=Vibrio phage nt-1 TaxID=115992 RepID=R9TEW4_9CAUD|nr:hypothetical protein VPFG_00328 [Vibrio phage nt-1]AGN30326.1 Vs.1 [Vibrio phage nt-1]
MKKLIALLLATCAFSASASQCKVNGQTLSEKQWHNVRAVFVNGWYYDLSWSLAAIAIVESSAGENMINHRTKDYGLMQNNIKTATTRLKRWRQAGRDFAPYNIDNPEDVKTILLTDRTVSVQLAIEELEFWKGVRGDNWREIYSSYNGGYYKGQKWEKRASKYADKIVNTMRDLKSCRNELMRGLY